MFKIYFVNSAYEKDQVLMYDDTRDDDDLKLGNPKLHIEVNAAGTLDFELPSTNVAYSRIIPMVTELHVIKDNQKTHDKHIWFGRVLTIDTDLYGTKTIHCEGGLAYLNDCIYYDKSVDHGSWSNQKTVGRAIFARYESPTLNEGGVHVYGVSPNEASAVIANIMSGGSNYKENLNAPFKHLGRIAKDTDSDVPIYAWVNEPVVPSGDQTDDDYYFDEDNLKYAVQNQCGISNPNNMTAIDLISSMMSNVGGLFWVSKTPQYPKRTFGGANSGDAVYVMQLHMRRYYPSFNPDEGQTIQIEENLTDLTITDDGTTFFTAVHPHGQHANSGEDFTLDHRGSQGGTTYINKRNWKVDPEHGVMYCPELVKQYGMIIRDLDVGTSNIYEQLVGMGISEIDRIPIISKTVGGSWTSGVRELTVKGIDMSLYNADYSSIELTDAVRVLAPRHGIDTYLNVTAIDYDLQNVENTVFTLNAIKSSNEITNASPSYGSSSVPQSSGSSYVHPKHTEHDLGLYKFSNDNLGHVNSAVAVTKKDITALGIPDKDTNTTYKLSKYGNTIKMTGSDGTTYTVDDSDTVYTHPKFTEYANGLYKIAVNDEGHVTNAQAVTKKDITALGIPGSIPIYNVDVDEEYGHSEGMIIATIVVNQTAHPIGVPIIGENENADYGLMSASDKKKLDGISDNANNYVHPTTSGNKHIPSGGSSGQILRWSADGTAVWGADNNTTYSDATQSTHGLMTAADKKKLDGMDLTKYLPKSGGVMTGDVDMQTNKKDILVGTHKATTSDGTAVAGGFIEKRANMTSTLPEMRSFIGSFHNTSADKFFSVISVRHQNGCNDGNAYGMYIFSNLTDASEHLKWGKQTASGTWTNDFVLLDSANFTSYAAKSNHTHDRIENNSKLIAGSNNAAQWCRLGTLTSSENFSTAVISVWSGDGANGNASQNSWFEIHIKDGWQSSQSATKACGVTVYRTRCGKVKVKVIPTAHDTFTVWVYLPWGYWNGNYAVNGRYKAWTTDFTHQTAEPEGTAADTAYYDQAFLTSTVAAAKTLVDSGWSSVTTYIVDKSKFNNISTEFRRIGQIAWVKCDFTPNVAMTNITICDVTKINPFVAVTPADAVYGTGSNNAGTESFIASISYNPDRKLRLRGNFKPSTIYRLMFSYPVT